MLFQNTMLGFGSNVNTAINWSNWDGTLDGAATQFETGTATATTFIASSKIDTDKLIVVYRYNGTILARIITISDTAITVGSAATVFASSSVSIAVTTLDTSRALCCYTDSSGLPRAVVLSISGTSITVNTASAAIEATSCSDLAVCKIDTNTSILVYYLDSSSGLRGVVLSTSGTSAPTAGSNTNLSPSLGGSTSISMAPLTTSTAIIALISSGTPSVRVVSVSGTSLSTLSLLTSIDAVTSAQISITTPTSTTAVVAYNDTTNSKGKAIGIELSSGGATLSLGTPVIFENNSVTLNNSQGPGGIVSMSATEIMVNYTATSTYGVVLILDGNSLVSFTRVQIDADSSIYKAPVTIDAYRVLAVYDDNGSSSRGTAKVLKLRAAP